MNCHNCKESKERIELVGANIFDASTGSHIITRWYCMECALTIGLISTEKLEAIGQARYDSE